MQNAYDCAANLYEKGLDLDPTEFNCCAWTKKTGIQAIAEDQGLPEKLCGQVVETTDAKELMRGCCDGMPNVRFDCDAIYRPSGWAWEDMLEFARYEDKWLKYFTKAWHIATENGQKLNYLDKDTGKASEVLSDEELTECLDIADKTYCEAREGCIWTKIAFYNTITHSGKKGCVNKHFVQSVQRHKLPRGKSFGKRNMEIWNTQYRRWVQLKNPTASSSLEDKPPTKVL